MAGIGFELKKLFHRKGLVAMVRAYGYAGVICTGPMLLGILLQFGVLAVSGWFEKRTFTSGVWWFKKDENTQLLPGGRRAYLWSSALSVAVSLLAMGLCLWVGQRWAAALPLVNGAALWLGFRMLFFGREE